MDTTSVSYGIGYKIGVCIGYFLGLSIFAVLFIGIPFVAARLLDKRCKKDFPTFDKSMTWWYFLQICLVLYPLSFFITYICTHQLLAMYVYGTLFVINTVLVVYTMFTTSIAGWISCSFWSLNPIIFLVNFFYLRRRWNMLQSVHPESEVAIKVILINLTMFILLGLIVAIIKFAC